MSTPGTTPPTATPPAAASAVNQNTPPNNNNQAPSMYARIAAVFENNKTFFAVLVALTLVTGSWKGKVAALVVSALTTALYTGYSVFISGRGKLRDASVKPQ